MRIERVEERGLRAEVEVSDEELKFSRADVEGRIRNRTRRFLELLDMEAPELLLECELELILRAYVLRRRLIRGPVH